jgi:hypothetical protein
MKQSYSFSDDGPKPCYGATCARCRVISSVLIALISCIVRRVPLSSREAREHIAAGNLDDGRPALFYRGHFITGLRLLPSLEIATLHLMVRTLTASIRSAIRVWSI